MILGILSDSHCRHERTAQAIRLLQGLGAEAFVHCGDIGDERVLDQLAGLRAWFVWGNTDRLGAVLSGYAGLLGLPLPGDAPLRLELAGRKLAVFHGHEPLFARLARFALAGRVAELEAAIGDCDYVLFGHSHRASDERVGRLHLVNPGALHRARPPTVATLDLKRDVVEFWQVGAAAKGQARRFQP